MKKAKRIKEYFVWIAVFMFACTLTSIASANPQAHFYAGYRYGKPDTPWTVSADIYTMDTGIPGSSFYAEWGSVILRYRPLYWVQTGYVKRWVWWWTQRDFYVETMDTSGHDLDYVDGTPGVRDTYRYIITYICENSWRIYIRKGAQDLYIGDVQVDPYEPSDLQAFVETTTTAICITGSHFRNLRYFTGTWKYWDTHVSNTTAPYYLLQVSHHEFYAYGGGS